MFSPVYAHPESFAGATDEILDIATDPLMAAILVDPIPMGELVYDYLTQWTEGPFVPHFYDGLNHQPFIGDTSGMGSPPLDYVSEPTSDFWMPSPSNYPNYLPFTPSPPPSEASSPERRQSPLPPHESRCHQANPTFESIRGKWCCNACWKDFRGHWECRRHILNAGKRAVCLACNKKINRRDDSLRRHYYKHCKRMDLGRDSENLRLEDAFVDV